MIGIQLDLPLARIADLCRRYRVRELAVFGSVLRDDFRPESDLDFLVLFEPEARVSFMTLGRMEQELARLVGRPVDLVPKRGLKPVICDEVLASARVLYAAE